MSRYQLAQVNVGIIRGPMDSRIMADFAANLDWFGIQLSSRVARNSPTTGHRHEEPSDHSSCNPS